MSCFGPDYNPNPTRLWSRFENNCVFQNSNGRSPDEQIYIPLLRRYVTAESLNFQLSVLKKGNVLQYKKNSSNITKNQKYAQIARGNWTNRTTTWATQTETYTNPNTNMLQRINYSNITADGIPTLDPITRCPISLLKENVSFMPHPNGNTNNGNNPLSPILPPPVISSNQNIVILIPPPIPPTIPVITPNIIIPNGGTLVCNTTENICTGEIIIKISPIPCVPTSSSDVPGPIMGLCYDDTIPTYYPKTSRSYPSSNYVSKDDIEQDYTQYSDVFANFSELVKIINQLLIDFSEASISSDKLKIFYDRLTTSFYIDINNKINDIKDKLSLNGISSTNIFLNGLLNILSNSFNNIYIYKDSNFNSVETEKLQTELDSIISILIRADPNEITHLIEKYLYKSLRPTGAFIDPIRIPGILLSIDQAYIIYIKTFGFPPDGIFNENDLFKINVAINTHDAFPTNEDTAIEITYEQFITYCKKTDTNFSVENYMSDNKFIVTLVKSGTLQISAYSVLSGGWINSDWNVNSNNIVDIRHKMIWTPSINFVGVVDAFSIKTTNHFTKSAWINVKYLNHIPTLIEKPITMVDIITTDENTRKKITYDDIYRHCYARDSDDINGHIVGFMITTWFPDSIGPLTIVDNKITYDNTIKNTISNGIFEIDTSLNTIVTLNQHINGIKYIIDASHNVYWTPALNKSGIFIVFKIEAIDNNGALSGVILDGALRTGCIPIYVNVNPAPNPPIFTEFNKILGQVHPSYLKPDGNCLYNITPIVMTFNDMYDKATKSTTHGTIISFLIHEVFSTDSGSLYLGKDNLTKTLFNKTDNFTIDSNNNAYWIPNDTQPNNNNDIFYKQIFSVNCKDDNNLTSDGYVIGNIRFNKISTT
jgi:hypothetical protein